MYGSGLPSLGVFSPSLLESSVMDCDVVQWYEGIVFTIPMCGIDHHLT